MEMVFLHQPTGRGCRNLGHFSFLQTRVLADRENSASATATASGPRGMSVLRALNDLSDSGSSMGREHRSLVIA